MQIIKNKKSEEVSTAALDSISHNSKGTLTISTTDGTLYNFQGDEKNKIIKFIKGIEND